MMCVYARVLMPVMIPLCPISCSNDSVWFLGLSLSYMQRDCQTFFFAIPMQQLQRLSEVSPVPPRGTRVVERETNNSEMCLPAAGRYLCINDA